MQKQNNYKVIAFDWDGTLFDSQAFIVDSFQWAAKKCDILVPTANDIRALIGLSLDEVLNRLFVDLKENARQHYIKTLRSAFDNDSLAKTKLFDGTASVLQELENCGYWLAIATGKCRKVLEHDMEQTNIKKHFQTTRCADETQSKPHPQMLLEIISEFGIEPHELLMVGDTEFDVLLANNANSDVLAVSYGVHDIAELLKHNIKGHIDDIKELPAWLR